MVVLATALILIAGVLYLLLREEMRYRRLADMERERSAMLGIISHLNGIVHGELNLRETHSLCTRVIRTKAEAIILMKFIL